jgi:hypothetical protein
MESGTVIPTIWHKNLCSIRSGARGEPRVGFSMPSGRMHWLIKSSIYRDD